MSSEDASPRIWFEKIGPDPSGAVSLSSTESSDVMYFDGKRTMKLGTIKTEVAELFSSEHKPFVSYLPTNDRGFQAFILADESALASFQKKGATAPTLGNFFIQKEAVYRLFESMGRTKPAAS